MPGDHTENNGRIEKDGEALMLDPRVDSATLSEAGEMRDMFEVTLPSEQINEDPSEQIGGSSKDAHGSASSIVHTHAAAISGTLQGLPSEKLMKKQVAANLEKEIRILKRRANRMRLPFIKFDAEKYQVLVAQIRSLGQILSSLMFATYETIKGLWLKRIKE